MLEDYRKTKRQMCADVGIMSIAAYVNDMNHVRELRMQSAISLRRSRKFLEKSEKINIFSLILSKKARKYSKDCVNRSESWLERSKDYCDQMSETFSTAMSNFTVPMMKELDAEIQRYPDLSAIYLGSDE